MTTTDSPNTSSPEPEPTHWTVGDIPPEPGTGTAVVDARDVVWTRESTGWQRAGLISFGGGTPWSRLLIERGPLTRLVPADAEREDTVDRLIRVNDTLRRELTRLRDATADRDRSTSESRHNTITRHRMNVVSNARRLLNKVAEADDPSDVDLRLVLGDLRYAVDTMDRYLMSPSGGAEA